MTSNEVNDTTAVSSSSENETRLIATILDTRDGWKRRGYCVPSKARPARIEQYKVPGYSTVYRNRHLFEFDQVYEVSDAVAQQRSSAAELAVITREENMTKAMQTAKITIQLGKTVDDIRELAYLTHGGNYQGDPGEFIWSNRKARNTIRHCLTNYETLWKKINRGRTGQDGYNILRERVDELVDESYPQFAEGMPEVC